MMREGAALAAGGANARRRLRRYAEMDARDLDGLDDASFDANYRRGNALLWRAARSARAPKHVGENFGENLEDGLTSGRLAKSGRISSPDRRVVIAQVIIDKALFDVVLCHPQNLSAVAALTAEASRVLKPGGAYVVVSHGAPATRLGYLERAGLGWSVAVVPVPKPKVSREPPRADDVYYCYVCRKKDDGARFDSHDDDLF